MTRKHFKRIASALKAAKQLGELTDKQHSIVVSEIGIACKAFNPAFNFDTFKEACQSN